MCINLWIYSFAYRVNMHLDSSLTWESYILLRRELPLNRKLPLPRVATLSEVCVMEVPVGRDWRNCKRRPLSLLTLTTAILMDRRYDPALPSSLSSATSTARSRDSPTVSRLKNSVTLTRRSASPCWTHQRHTLVQAPWPVALLTTVLWRKWLTIGITLRTYSKWRSLPESKEEWALRIPVISRSLEGCRRAEPQADPSQSDDMRMSQPETVSKIW